MTTVPSLDELTEALVRAAPVLNRRGRLLALALYHELARGAPVEEAVLCECTGLSAGYVADTLASWPGVFRDEAGRIVAFWGLALPETPHSLHMAGVRLHAWCAWDTRFLPQILRVDADVRSPDPTSGEAVELRVTPHGVEQRSHANVVVSFLAPDAGWDGDVITSFCHFIDFFTDPESARPWISAHEGTFLLTLDDAFTLGARWIRARGLG